MDKDIEFYGGIVIGVILLLLIFLVYDAIDTAIEEDGYRSTCIELGGMGVVRHNDTYLCQTIVNGTNHNIPIEKVMQVQEALDGG